MPFLVLEYNIFAALSFLSFDQKMKVASRVFHVKHPKKDPAFLQGLRGLELSAGTHSI